MPNGNNKGVVIISHPSANEDVGKYVQRAGDVTQLNAITHTPPRVLEKRLGYEENRLSQGFFVLKLVEKVEYNDFLYGKNTSFSGGIEPDTVVEFAGEYYDVHIHDSTRYKLYDEVGDATKADEIYDRLIRDQYHLLNDRQSHKRIVKVLPIIPHDQHKPRDIQYPDAPPSGGVKQWTLRKPKLFLIAAKIPPGCIYSGGGAKDYYK